MISDFIDMLRGDWSDKLLALLISACLALLLWLACWGIFVAADSWFISDSDGTAEVCGRNHTAAWTQVIVHSTGKSTWTQVVYHPESWTVRMQMGRLAASVSVSEHTYDTVMTGQQVPVRYRRGRFSDDLYITEAFFR